MSHIKGDIQCLCDRLAALEAKPDSDNQNLNYNCDTGVLDISGGNSVTIPTTQTVYTEVLTPGVVEQIWSGAGNSTTHANASEIFIGPAGSPNGLPGHVNGAPDIDIVVADWIDNTVNDPSNGADQFRWYGWLEILNDGTQIRDINGNTGELVRVWHATCCSAAQVVFEGPGTPGAGVFATLDAGWHFIAFEGSDGSAYAGVQLQIDNAGNGVFANFSGRTSTTCPDYTCRQESACYELKTGESFKAPSCNLPANAILPGGEAGLSEQEVQDLIDASATDHVEPATSAALLESDNNHSEGSWIRTGNVGTSLKYAREDHQHPIVRIPNPGTPVITLVGPATATSNSAVRTWTDEESVEYGYRVNLLTTTVNGWVRLVIPNLAGFQRPIISGIGSYRYSGNYDTDGTGAANNSSVPQAAWMGQEVNHYLFTQSIYVGRVSDKETDARWWINFNVKYIRN